MARRIKCTDEEVNRLMLQFEQALKHGKYQDGKISFETRMPENDDVAALTFTNKAWLKIMSLVMSFDKEVQWHGVVERISDNEFKVKDILVFPHEITSATVTSNQEEYEQWLNNLDDDTFNHLRFHGHSHVNMGVTPSSVDMQYRENILVNISPNDDEAYYIFIIVNKKYEISAEIYDIKNNILYGKSDIEMFMEIGDGEFLNDFLVDAKEIAKERIYTTTYTPQTSKKEKKKNKNNNNYYYGFGRDFYDDGEFFET